jgi:ABC-type Fe3+/spermidine/putrescine transport system ATPase subunit
MFKEELMAQPLLSLHNIYKSFGDEQVLTDLSFDLVQGEFFTLLGSSGSGKSTTQSPASNTLKLQGSNRNIRALHG